VVVLVEMDMVPNVGASELAVLPLATLLFISTTEVGESSDDIDDDDVGREPAPAMV
jgi:hypothetical protein